MSKRMLITGAGRRLGKTLALHFLQQGWQVVAHYNTVSELPEHSELSLLQANLANTSETLAMCQQLQQQLPFDAVIHNASCFVPDAASGISLAEQAAHLTDHLNVHVMAPALITQALEQRWNTGAAMVVLADIYADIPNQRFSAYCASKAGLQNWALSMAQRLAGQVRVNVIQPGPIRFLPDHDVAYRQRVLSQSLIPHELGYGAIAKACDYLLDNEAVTGSVMRVDGGRFVANRYDQTFTND
ncbi:MULTISPECIES: SDR family oxidoreductase [unclassified Oceanobacter]|uniref:SDR family oxidoreductase n=2 Tax=Gammaproteobacteria TaxID=1236 RepID=UPI002736F4BA|nr:MULTISPECIES: SDR family oxidoreductase [unclassified Oceanobacter]MDP2608339.1 SDR family oxidoreductase [Oceanobacter sp. 1_MG-2023]MDP2612224.1 SDR family oxidoreductase [Oceanobacter sp. 2_MG-2023]